MITKVKSSTSGALILIGREIAAAAIETRVGVPVRQQPSESRGMTTSVSWGRCTRRGAVLTQGKNGLADHGHHHNHKLLAGFGACARGKVSTTVDGRDIDDHMGIDYYG